MRIYEWIRSRPMLIVLNKIDLLNGSAARAEVPDDWSRERCVRISALSGQGVEELQERIIQTGTRESGIEVAGTVIPNLRQKELLERSLASAAAAATDVVNGSGRRTGFHSPHPGGGRPRGDPGHDREGGYP